MDTTTPVQGPYDALTGRELTDDEIVAATAALQRAHEELRVGHLDRVRNFEAGRARRRGKPHRIVQDLTGAQRHKRALADADIALSKRVEDSGLWDGVPRSRRSWCSRLRELELHPERFDAIKARSTRAQVGRLAAARAEAESADA